MFNLYNICLLRAFEHIHMEFARYKCLLLLLLLLLLLQDRFETGYWFKDQVLIFGQVIQKVEKIADFGLK